MPRSWFPAALVLAAVLAGSSVGSAQFSPVDKGTDKDLRVYVYTLRHQPANEALFVVQALLSPRGRVEIQPEEGNVVVRDIPQVLDRVVPALQSFDHPIESVDLEVRLIQAGPVGPRDAPPGLPLSVLLQLHRIYRFEGYRLLAGVDLRAQEGVEVSHQVSREYVVKFRVGTILEDSRIRLTGFKVSRATADPQARPLLATTLTPWLGQTLVLGLAQAEDSTSALLVAVTCRKSNPGPGAH